jgi:hypothetical protein
MLPDLEHEHVFHVLQGNTLPRVQQSAGAATLESIPQMPTWLGARFAIVASLRIVATRHMGEPIDALHVAQVTTKTKHSKEAVRCVPLGNTRMLKIRSLAKSVLVGNTKTGQDKHRARHAQQAGMSQLQQTGV